MKRHLAILFSLVAFGCSKPKPTMPPESETVQRLRTDAAEHKLHWKIICEGHHEYHAEAWVKDFETRWYTISNRSEEDAAKQLALRIENGMAETEPDIHADDYTVRECAHE